MNWRLFVSLRYLSSKPRERFISLVSMMSVAGVAVGVAALIVVLAVMSGFDKELKEKLVGVYSHVVVDSDYGFVPTDELFSKVTSIPHVVAGAYYINGQALVSNNEGVTGVIVRGIDPVREPTVSGINKYINKGSLDLSDNGIIIGSELATRLSLEVGDKVKIISSSLIKGKDSKIKGIFKSGMYEYDSNLVYMSIPESQELFAATNLVSGIALKVDDAFNARQVKDSLAGILGPPFTVRTWMDLNRNLLSALKLEKTVMFIILTLIVVVACFNIASSLIMTVLEKTKDIGMLKAIGASASDIMIIFTVQGGVAGILGTLLGGSFGALICWLLSEYKFIDLPKDIYYIDKLPVDMQFTDMATIVISSIVLCILAALYPAYRASRLDPVEALRYE